jgi:hypothetical protein
MTDKLQLPRDLTKGDVTLTATTATEYYNLVNGRGFEPVPLTPQEKAARTRAANKEQEVSSNPDENPDARAGDATGDES